MHLISGLPIHVLGTVIKIQKVVLNVQFITIFIENEIKCLIIMITFETSFC